MKTRLPTKRCRSSRRTPMFWVIAICLNHGCMTTPTERTEALAQRAGAAIERIHGEGFEHVVISHRVFANTRDANDSTLHIYFSGDGTPWIHHTKISADPTPRDPIALRLMLEDPAGSIYIGRPCYHGLEKSTGCGPALWTSARYSQAVVDSMASAVRQILDRIRPTQVVMFGYSGGGVLALLVANQVSRIDTVVTIGTNLDIDAWTALHGYTALSDSVNPMDVQKWRVSLRQIHFVGESDTNVPPAIAARFAGDGSRIEIRVIPGFDHRCCWVEAWPKLLQTLGGVHRIDHASLPPQHTRLSPMLSPVSP